MLNNLSRTLNDGPLRYGIRNTPVEVSKSRRSAKFQNPHPLCSRRRNATTCCTKRCAETSQSVPHSPAGIQPLPLHHTQPKNTGIQQDASSPHPLQNSHTVAQTQHLHPPQSPKTLRETLPESAAATPWLSPADPSSASFACPHAPAYDSETQTDHGTNGSAAVTPPHLLHPESPHHS